MAPKSAPGKNPATTAVLGNEGHDVVGMIELAVSLESETDDGETDGDGTGVRVVADVEPDVAVLDVLFVSVAEVFLSKTQVLFAAQEYPKGQQAPPQMGSESFNLVVLTKLSK